MAVGLDEAVGRVEVDPAPAGDVQPHPGVGGVGPHQPGQAGRRGGLQVAADVAGAQAQRAQRPGQDVGEVLAHAPALGQRPEDGVATSVAPGTNSKFRWTASVRSAAASPTGRPGVNHSAARARRSAWRGTSGESSRHSRASSPSSLWSPAVAATACSHGRSQAPPGNGRLSRATWLVAVTARRSWRSSSAT